MSRRRHRQGLQNAKATKADHYSRVQFKMAKSSKRFKTRSTSRSPRSPRGTIHSSPGTGAIVLGASDGIGWFPERGQQRGLGCRDHPQRPEGDAGHPKRRQSPTRTGGETDRDWDGTGSTGQQAKASQSPRRGRWVPTVAAPGKEAKKQV